MGSGRQFHVFEMYLKEIEEIPCCDEAENRELAERISRGDAQAGKRLVEGNLKLALEMTRDYLNRGVHTADLVQEANMALVLAARELEGPSQGQLYESFEGFLRERVNAALKAVVDEQDTQAKIGEEMLARVNMLQEVSKELAQRLGREATVEELAERMGMTADEIKDIMKLTLEAMSVTGE